jgi:hypothetical protein
MGGRLGDVNPSSSVLRRVESGNVFRDEFELALRRERRVPPQAEECRASRGAAAIEKGHTKQPVNTHDPRKSGGLFFCLETRNPSFE